MPGTRVGAIFADVGYHYDDSGLARFRRDLADVRADARRGAEARLEGNVQQQEFDRYERALREARDDAKRGAESKLEADVVEREFDRYERALDTARRDAQRGAEANLDADVDQRDFSRYERELDEARRDAQRGATADLDARVDSSGFRRYERDVGRAGRQTDGFRRGVSRATGLLGAAGLGAALGIAGRQIIGFDRGLRNVNSIAQLSERELGKLRDRVLALASETAQSPQTLVEGLYDLVSSGFDAAEAVDVLRASAFAATAGLTETGTSAKVVAGVINAYGLEAKDAEKVSDILFRTVDRGVVTFEQLANGIGPVLPFASKLGVPLEQVGAAIATMTKAGIPAANAMTFLRQGMVALTKPTTAMKDAFEELGVSGGEELVEKTGSVQAAFDALIGTTDGTSESVAGLFSNVRSQAAAFALTGRNAEGAAQDLKGMQDASGATSKALEQQSQSVAYQWSLLKAEASAMAIEFGQKLIPRLLEIANILRDPKLTGEEKWNRIRDIIVPALERAFSGAITIAGKLAPQVAAAFIRGFLDAPPLGRLLAGAWIFAKARSLLGAFGLLGQQAGGRFAAGAATTAGTTVAGGAPAPGGRGGRVRGALGGALRFGAGLAAVNTAFDIADLARGDRETELAEAIKRTQTKGGLFGAAARGLGGITEGIFGGSGGSALRAQAKVAGQIENTIKRIREEGKPISEQRARETQQLAKQLGFSSKVRAELDEILRVGTRRRTPLVAFDLVGELQKQRRLTPRLLNQIIGSLNDMPPKARRIAGATVVGMARQMERDGKLPRGSAKKIADFVALEVQGMERLSVRSARRMARRMGISARDMEKAVMEPTSRMGRRVAGVLEAFGASGTARIRAEIARASSYGERHGRDRSGDPFSGGLQRGGFLGGFQRGGSVIERAPSVSATSLTERLRDHLVERLRERVDGREHERIETTEHERIETTERERVESGRETVRERLEREALRFLEHREPQAATQTFQRGGFFRGTGRQDSILYRGPARTAVLNAHQQAPAEYAMAVSKELGVQPYGSLGEMFARSGGTAVPASRMGTALVAPGEAAVPPDQQGPLERALRSVFGFGLQGLFGRERRPHATAQRGIVAIPGEPGESIHRSILNDVLALKSRYKLDITDGYATSGHAPKGEHPQGLAVDAVPGRGGSWDLIDKLAAWAHSQVGRIFRWVGYNNAPGHGRGHHIHLSWLAGGRGVGGAGEIGDIPRFIARVSGRRGGFRGLAQGGLSLVAQAANRFLRRRIGETPVADVDEPGAAAGGFSKAQLKQLWIKAGGARSRANLAAAVAMAESGGRTGPAVHSPNPGGGINRGPWQIWSGHADSTDNPLGNARAAVRISDNGTDWSQWEAYTNGNYRPFLARGGFLQRLQGGGFLEIGGSGFTPGEQRRTGRRERSLSRIDTRIDRLQRRYDLAARRFDLTEEPEDFIVEEEGQPPRIDEGAFNRKAEELGRLLVIRQQILAAWDDKLAAIAALVDAYRKARERIEMAIGVTRQGIRQYSGRKGKEAKKILAGLRDRLGKYQAVRKRYNTKLGSLADERAEVGFDRESSALDVAELQKEIGALDINAARRALDQRIAEQAETPEGAAEPGEAAPTPEQIAEAAAEQLRSFQAARQELFRDFGSGFLPARFGRGGLFPDPSSQAAGARAFGAFGGQDAGGGFPSAPGRGTVILVEKMETNFPEGPPDGHVFIDQARFRLEALTG